MARRIVFGTQVVPTEVFVMDDGISTREEIRTHLWLVDPLDNDEGLAGGVPVASDGSIVREDTQSGGWISGHASSIWQAVSYNWNAVSTMWGSSTIALNITRTPVQLNNSSDKCAFIYVQNAGATYPFYLSLNGDYEDK